MYSILFIVFPPLAVWRTGRWGAAMLNVVFTLCGWIPGVLHAFAVIHDTDAAQKAQDRLNELRRANGREGMRGQSEMHVMQKTPAVAVLSFLLSSAFVFGVFWHGSAISWVERQVDRFWTHHLAAKPPAEPEVKDSPAVAATPVPETPPAEQPAEETAKDTRPMSVVLRERVKWPMRVTLKTPLTVTLFDAGEPVGEAVLVAGQILPATELCDEGHLAIAVANQTIELAMENTDFMDRVLNGKAATVPASDTQVVNADHATNAAVRRARVEYSADQRLLALKNRFPPKYRSSAGVVTPGRTYYDSNIRERIVNGKVVAAEVRTGHHGPGYTQQRYDNVMVDVPHPDLWSSYRSWISTATIQGLPKTIALVESQMQNDIARLSGEASQPGGAQARASINWIQRTFVPYLGQLKALAGQR